MIAWSQKWVFKELIDFNFAGFLYNDNKDILIHADFLHCNFNVKLELQSSSKGS